MDTRWQIELLGGLRATGDDRTVTRFQTHKTGALLAYLAYYCRLAHPRELLIERFWPESEPHSGRNKLSLALSSLRHQLEPPGTTAGAVILANRSTVQLNPAAVRTNVAQFEAALRVAGGAASGVERAHRLVEAIELYHGELLPDHFEDWILPERHHLANAHLQALDQLIAQWEQAGHLPRALQYARRAVSADPLREEAHHALIRLLAAAGQPEAALNQSQELERLLAQELAAEPAPETQALVKAIRDRRASVKGRSVCTVTVPPLPAPMHDPLIGTMTLLLIERVSADQREQGLAESASQADGEECWTRLRSLCRGHGGHPVPLAPEALAVAFGRASDALAAAVAAQQGVGSDASWSLRPHPSSLLRMALHTGEAEPGGDTRYSPVVEHATRLLLAAHPGQILLTEKSAVLLRDDVKPGVHLLSLGRFRLHTESPPEQLFQVCSPDLPAREFPPPNALPAHEGSLPLPLTRFFGREEEIARLLELLKGYTMEEGSASSSPRLVTLTGPGGSGKTRLALEVAGQLRAAFHGAVWFVPLQDLTEARLIPDKLLDVLRLPRSPQFPPLEQVTTFLSRQPSLLLLDNFEHLVTDGAPLVQTLLEQVPTLTCLVTSRQRLNLAGEQEFPVAPLPVPAEGPSLRVEGSDASRDREGAELSALAQCASVRLFVDRAQAVQPHFQITARNAGAVAALCRRLDGLPLALELAAARVGVLTPAQMVERLSQRFELLASNQRGTVPRHRSLWAALDWSYQLLSPELQRFFARLSVFQGGWTLAAAETACDEPKALHYLEQLQECTLVQAEEAGGGTAERSEEVMRFRLLETLREFGEEQLGPEERAALAQRHASYYLALAERAEPELVRAEQVAWLDRLERDLDNLRAALAWLGAERSEGGGGRIQEALRLGGALRRFWQVRGGFAEGLRWLKWLLALPGAEVRTAARAKALNAAGLIANALGDRVAARSLSEESLAIGRELGDRWNMALALTCLGGTFSDEGNLEAASSLLEEALAIWRELGDSWGVDRARNVLGWVAYQRRDYEAARALCQECLRVRSERGDRWGIAQQLYLLGAVAREEGEYEEARVHAEQFLSLAQEFGDRRSISFSLLELGHVAYLQGDLPAARALLDQSLALAREIGDRAKTGWNLVWLTEVSADQGDTDTASASLEEALRLGWKPGDPSHGTWPLLQQGRIALQRGDRLAARRCFGECLARAQAAGGHHEIVHSLEGLAAVAADEGEPERASRLFAAAAALREADGRPARGADRSAPVRAAPGGGARRPGRGGVHGGLGRGPGDDPRRSRLHRRGVRAARRGRKELAVSWIFPGRGTGYSTSGLLKAAEHRIPNTEPYGPFS